MEERNFTLKQILQTRSSLIMSRHNLLVWDKWIRSLSYWCIVNQNANHSNQSVIR